MTLLRWLWLICLFGCSEAYAAYCSDIWTQAIRSNSAVPSTLTLPGTTNPSFPQPLQPTDYYYPSGNYFIDNGTVRTTSGATTRLFFDGNLTIYNNTQLNAGGPPQNLILVVTGNLVLNNNVVINGFVLVGGAVQLYNNAVVNGAITSKGAAGNFGGFVNYRPEAIPLLKGGVVCDTAPVQQLLLAHYPLDICGGTTPGVIEDLTGNYPATAVRVKGQSAGKVLEAADFSASPDDFINVPAAALNGLTNFSVSMWFKLLPGSGFRELISASSPSSDIELEIYVNGSNEVRAGLKGAYYGFTGGSSSSVVSNNTWYQLTLTRNGTNLCLYLNNNLVRCVTASSSALSITKAAIGIWVLGNGATTDDFRGDIDEVLLFNYALPLAQIQQMYTYQNSGLAYDGVGRSSVCPQIDHFELSYTGQALTCKAEPFTLKACKNASCSELVTSTVTATLSPASAGTVNWLGGNTISFSGGQIAVNLRSTVAGIVTVGISGSVPSVAPSGQTLCRAGNGALSTGACDVLFSDSGLIFAVPDGIANLPEQNVVISAVRKSDASQQCEPEFTNTSRSLQFWSDYVTPGPANRVASEAISVNGTNIGQSEAQASTQVISFNAQGQAVLTVNYPDAGLVQLNARYIGSAASSDAGLIMQGADQFIRRPLGLCIATGGECASANSNCGKFAVAGEPFNLTISGHRYENNGAQYCSNPVTPSFSHNGIVLNHQLVAPLPGQSGTISSNSYNHQASVNGETQVAQSVSEVGVFTFGTGAFNYLGMADAVPAANSAATGRFVPAAFNIDAGLAVPACGSFSYFAQPSISTAFNLSARNVTGQVTQNYRDGFAKLNVQQWTNLSAAEGLRFSATLPAGADLIAGAMAPVGSWVDGEAEIIATHIASRPSVPSAPFDLTVLAQPRDSDGVLGLSSAVNNSPTELRYGRLVLANVAGAQEEPLPLSFSTEYWLGDRFIRNLADSCTLISASNSLLKTPQGTPTLTLDGTDAQIQQGLLPANPIWIRPIHQVGYWTIEYQAEPWLQYYWRGSTVDYQQDPRAEVIFGRFRGNPRQIFWREVFQ